MLEKVYRFAPIDWTAGSDLQHMNHRRKIYIEALKAADNFDLVPLLAFTGGETNV